MMEIGLMIEAMEYAEQRSNYSSVASMIAFYDKSIKERGDARSIKRYDELVQRTALALECERRFGAGSLLDLEHLDNVELIRAGIIRSHKVEAALRYRERICAFKSETKMLNRAPNPAPALLPA